MKIKYNPVYDIGTAIHRNSAHLETKYPGIAHWYSGEVKDIPDDLKFPETKSDGTFLLVPLIDDLLSNPIFQIVNEDGTTSPSDEFLCSRCEQETVEGSTMHPKSGDPIPLEINGKRVCSACFDAADKTLTPSGYEFPSEDNN